MTIDNSTITALTGLAVVITAPIMLYLQIQAKKQSKVQDVKIDQVQALGKETHGLVNSSFGTQLLVSSGFAQRIADLTKDPADAQVAVDTKAKYDDHMAKQAAVDNASAQAQGKPT